MAALNDEEVMDDVRPWRDGGRVTVDRPTYDEQHFEESFPPMERQRLQMSTLEPIRGHLTPPKTCKEWKRVLLGRLPILIWLYQYLPSLLFGDVISGITVGIMHIPQGMAYASLAKVPHVYGLYVSFLSPLIYSIFGTSKHMSIGTFAVVSLMVGDATNRYIDDNPSLCEVVTYVNGTNETGGGLIPLVTELDLLDCPKALEVVIAITFVTGLIMTVFGILQLGFITIFLSEALISGYTTGAAVQVLTSQLRYFVGLSSSEVDVDPGAFELPKTWAKVIDEVVSGNIVWAAVIISVLCVTFLIIVNIVNKQLLKIRLYRKLPIPIPGQLILVIVVTVINSSFDLDHNYDVPTVGHIPEGLPPTSTPKSEYFGDILTDAFTIAIVAYSISISLSKVFANKHGYSIHANQEFLAHGFTNLASSFFSCFVCCGSLSRSAIQEVTGGNTQLVSFISSSILLVVLLWVAPLFERLPTAVLASIIAVALFGMFRQFKDVLKYYKTCLPDMLVWIVVFIATVLLGAGTGLIVGIQFSLFLIVIRIILPTSAVLGKAANTEIYVNQLDFSNVQKIPGVLIFRFVAPLCFTNVSVFKARLIRASRLNPARTNHVKRQKGCIEQAVEDVKDHLCYHHDREGYESIGDDEDHENSEINTGNIQEDIEAVNYQSIDERIHTIVLDMAPVSFIDSAGAKTILHIVSRYAEINIQVLLAATNKVNKEMLIRSGFMDQFGKERLFPSIEDAVRFATEGKKAVRTSKSD